MAKIESYIEPATLYRYRSLEEIDHEIDAISRATLYCAPYSTLNDPMEGFYTTNRLQRESDKYARIRSLIANSKNDLGICSFSEVHNNEIMWAHYADEFRGICIAYRFKSLLSYLDKRTEFVRLSYLEKAPTLLANKTIEFSARRFLSCKSYKWLYEREWRMFAPQGIVTYTTVKCVRRVYLGSRISKHNKVKVLSKLKPSQKGAPQRPRGFPPTPSPSGDHRRVEFCGSRPACASSNGRQ